MRKLVTIRTIDDLLPIQKADKIQLAVIGGWQVIVKKDEFKIGDYCCFFEIDSFLPLEDRYSFLKKTTYCGKEGYRIKAMKMKGALSQGLALPLSMFPDLTSLKLSKAFEVGMDITDRLGVIKYDNAVASQKEGVVTGNADGKFPDFIPKTDQERVQNLMSHFKTRTHDYYEETLKLDGSSMTCYKIELNKSIFQRLLSLLGIESSSTKFGVCSRNIELKKSLSSDFWKTAINKKIEEKLPDGYAVQGELIGPKIQSNHEKVQDLDYYIFDVYNIKEKRYLLPFERQNFCRLRGLRHVPVISNCSQPFNNSLDNLLKSVEGESINKGTISEGRVFKHMTMPDVTFKAISNKYLLKSEK